MPGWTLVDTHPSQGRTFQRPLGRYEFKFYRDGLFNGTADGILYLQLHVQDASVFSEDNIARAWLSTKRRFPLLGAIVQASTDAIKDSASEFHFVVRERDFAVARPCDVIFGQVTSEEDARQRVIAILNGPRPLSDERLSRLCVFHETARTGVHHVMLLTAHCVTDGTANKTLARCFLDTLARGGVSEPAQMPLEERLAMAVPSEALEPERVRAIRPAVRRWRRAAAAVIHQSRMDKMQGGHTLPCRITRSTPCVPAQTRTIFTSLTTAQTTAVLTNCRQHALTFGSALVVLAQVAMTRVLYRRYRRGEISEQEWAYRKRQPHITTNPVNVRRFLDETWLEQGGAGEFVSSIGFAFVQLPFMTLGGDQHDDVPPFSDLLTFDRFLHRTRWHKKKMNALVKHPLFHETMYAAGMGYVQRTRPSALQCVQHTETANTHDSDKVLAVNEIPMVFADGGASLGNVDLICPTEYPLPHTHPLSPDAPSPHPFKAGYVTSPSPSPFPSPSSSSPSLPSTPVCDVDSTPKVTVVTSSVYLHARPGELYLGAATSHGQMSMYTHYDGNVFEEGVVREWSDEVKDAMLWYLGRAQ